MSTGAAWSDEQIQMKLKSIKRHIKEVDFLFSVHFLASCVLVSDCYDDRRLENRVKFIWQMAFLHQTATVALHKRINATRTLL